MSHTAPFDSSTLWVVSTSPLVASAVSAFLTLFKGPAFSIEFSVNTQLTISNAEDLHSQFSEMSLRQLANSICLVDLCSSRPPASWKLDEDHTDLHPAELPLRYPEVLWVFLVDQKPAFASEADALHFVTVSRLVDLITLLKRHSAGLRSVFDPSGMRAHLMQDPRTDLPISIRGLAVEDEVSYCMLNAYSLYRRGVPTYIAPTQEEFLNTTALMKCGTRTWHVIEDVELQYPDSGIDDELYFRWFMPIATSNEQSVVDLLNRRAERYSQLGSRTIVSVVRVSTSVKSLACSTVTVTKPYSGFYDRRFAAQFTHVSDEVHDPGANRSVSVSGHSAPGAHEKVATHLLRRARRHIQSVTSPEDAIQVAVLASVAERLLGGLTTHMALEAVAIRHRMEVTAECMFIGTSNKLDVTQRIRDIKRSVNQIVKFTPGNPLHLVDPKAEKRRKQRANAMLEICGELRDVYKDYDQLDEEDRLLIYYRDWERCAAISSPEHPDRWFSDYRGLGRWLHVCGLSWVQNGIERLSIGIHFVFLWFVHLPRWYFNLFLRGWPEALGICAGWILLYALWFQYLADVYLPKQQWHVFTLHDYVLQSTVTFISFQPLDGGPSPSLIEMLKTAARDGSIGAGEIEKCTHWVWRILSFEIITGYVHLGAFLALFLHRFSKR